MEHRSGCSPVTLRLLFTARAKHEMRIKTLESGEAFQALKKKHREDLSYQDRRIKELQKLLGKARRETIDV